MNYCPNCGEEISEGTKFCSSCGSEISVEKSKGQPSNTSSVADVVYEQKPSLLKQMFDFNNRVTKVEYYEKTVNDTVIGKIVTPEFSWLGALFTYIYPLFTKKYNTQGFEKKIVLINIIYYVVFMVAIIIAPILYFILLPFIFILEGFMFNSWYRDQLVENGYHQVEKLSENATQGVE